MLFIVPHISQGNKRGLTIAIKQVTWYMNQSFCANVCQIFGLSRHQSFNLYYLSLIFVCHDVNSFIGYHNTCGVRFMLVHLVAYIAHFHDNRLCWSELLLYHVILIEVHVCTQQKYATII